MIFVFVYSRKFSHKWNQLLSLFGFSLMIMSVVFLDNRQIPPFPNLYTLIPTSGAALIILCGEKNTLVGYLLSTRLLRWIGLISYSAYLWHQPLLAYLRLYSNQTSQSLTIILVVSVVFVLSIFSYLFVEQPFRDKKRFSRKDIFLIAGASTLILLIIALFLIKTADNRSLIINKDDDPYLADLTKYGNGRYVTRAFDALARKKKRFSSRTSRLNRRIAIIGDSFVQDLYNMIIEGKRLINFDIWGYYLASPCQIYLGNEDRTTFIAPTYRQLCTNAYDIKYALPMIRQADIIILSSYWYFWSAQKLPNTIKALNLNKQQQIIVIGRKDFGNVNPMLYVNKTKQFRIKQFQYPRRDVIKINELLEKTIDKSIFVNILKIICTGFNQTCPLFTPDGNLISYDGLHLTKHGARYVGDLIFQNTILKNLK